MINAAKNITKLNLPELSEYNKRLSEGINTFRKITNNSWLLVSGKTSGGNLSDMLMEYVRMFTHVDLIKFNSMLVHLGKYKTEIYDLMETLGTIEAMISVASFRHLLPYFVRPEFTEDKELMVKDLYHLSIKAPVANSITTEGPVLITGSNASGKSTFLKSVAINTILAQTINTCPCEDYRAPFFRIYSSMALSDDLDMGDSYYIVEIKSLKRIVDASKKKGERILCFIDEVLRGTNTVERIAASSEILKNLSDAGVMCFAATHDIELTRILENDMTNYHFSEYIENDQVLFDYLIKEGPSTSRNAIKLLKVYGYDQELVDSAETMAHEMMEEAQNG
jgi:DNA mismatch repair ATPase MutS